MPFGPDAKEVGSDSSKLSAVEDGLVTPYVTNIGVAHCLNLSFSSFSEVQEGSPEQTKLDMFFFCLVKFF